MANDKEYRCVNCGVPCYALYRTYGPSVLKLTKCIKCKGTVDKYIEYDPVIVMIDLVLVSKEAQRHVLYNTDFKAFWKLFIILMMLETYAVWRSDSLFSIAVNTLCDVKGNYIINSSDLNIPIRVSLPETWKYNCEGWVQESRGDDTDLFIWEKDFYVQFISTFSGIVVFMSTVHVLMNMFQTSATKRKVSTELVVKAFALGAASAVFALPALVWGAAESAGSGLAHYTLVFAYSYVVFSSVYSVLYESPIPLVLLVLTAGNCAKYLTTFHMTPFLRGYII